MLLICRIWKERPKACWCGRERTRDSGKKWRGGGAENTGNLTRCQRDSEGEGGRDSEEEEEIMNWEEKKRRSREEKGKLVFPPKCPQGEWPFTTASYCLHSSRGEPSKQLVNVLWQPHTHTITVSLSHTLSHKYAYMYLCAQMPSPLCVTVHSRAEPNQCFNK